MLQISFYHLVLGTLHWGARPPRIHESQHLRCQKNSKWQVARVGMTRVWCKGTVRGKEGQ